MTLEGTQALLDYIDFMRLPPESPGEVIDGILTIPSPRNVYHQLIVGSLGLQIGRYLDDHPDVGIYFALPLDVVLRQERPAIVLQPDLQFISAARENILGDRVMGAPDLTVEVVSPATMRMDNVRKRELYAQFGVQEYWLVWPDDERIDVFKLCASGTYETARAFAAGETLTTDLLPGFELSVARVFARRPGGTGTEKGA